MEKVVENDMDITSNITSKIVKTYLNTLFAKQRIEIFERELEHQLVHISSFTSNLPRYEELLSRTPSGDEEEKAFKKDSEQLKMDQRSQFAVKRTHDNTLWQEKNHIDRLEKKNVLDTYYDWDNRNR